MYKINTGSHSFEVEMDRAGTSGKVNGEDYNIDLVKLSEKTWHLIKDNKSYNIQIANADMENKLFQISVNGNTYELKAKDDFDLLLDKMGLANLTQTKINNIKAPMPGLVLQIMASVGQEVEKNTPLFILEAMKMENVLKSPTDGVIKSIGVEKGQAVEKNHVLLTFE